MDLRAAGQSHPAGKSSEFVQHDSQRAMILPMDKLYFLSLPRIPTIRCEYAKRFSFLKFVAKLKSVPQWSSSKKAMILVVVSLYSFLGNTATLGPSVYIEIFSKEFGVSPAAASGLISYSNLVYGFGKLDAPSCALRSF